MKKAVAFATAFYGAAEQFKSEHSPSVAVCTSPKVIVLVPSWKLKVSSTLRVFESAIDLLSYATVRKLGGRPWQADHLLSLAGVYEPPKNTDITIPLALSRYLEKHLEIKKIILRLDRDYTGYTAGQALTEALSPQYTVSAIPPPKGKVYAYSL